MLTTCLSYDIGCQEVSMHQACKVNKLLSNLQFVAKACHASKATMPLTFAMLQILGVLAFELTVPTVKTFLRRFLKAALPGAMPADARLECLSSYLAELMLPEYRALQFLPSQVVWHM